MLEDDVEGDREGLGVGAAKAKARGGRMVDGRRASKVCVCRESKLEAEAEAGPGTTRRCGQGSCRRGGFQRERQKRREYKDEMKLSRLGWRRLREMADRGRGGAAGYLGGDVGGGGGGGRGMNEVSVESRRHAALEIKLEMARGAGR